MVAIMAFDSVCRGPGFRFAPSNKTIIIYKYVYKYILSISRSVYIYIRIYIGDPAVVYGCDHGL